MAADHQSRRRENMQDVIKINQEDNVAVALRPIAKGETLDIAGTPVTTLEEIPQGHKVAM